MTKTNALRQLEAGGIPFAVYEYDVSDGQIDGVRVAAKLGRDTDTVFKTLVTVGKTTGLNVFVVPVDCTLDLKKAARAAGDKFIELLPLRELEPRTGYLHGGCSPVGMKKALPTYIEEMALSLDAMMVNAGRIGLQMELAPADLARVTGGVFSDLV